MIERCSLGHLLVPVTPDEGAVLVHVFEADAEECTRLGGMIGPPSDKDT